MLQQTSRQIRTSSRSGLGSVQSPLSNPPPPTSSSSSSSKRPRNPFGNPFSYSSNGSSSGWVSSDILKFGIFSRDLSPSDEDATGDELNEPILYFYPSDIAPAMRVKFMNTVLGLGAIFYLFTFLFFRRRASSLSLSFFLLSCFLLTCLFVVVLFFFLFHFCLQFVKQSSQNTNTKTGDFMRNFSSTDKITSVHFETSRLAIYE